MKSHEQLIAYISSGIAQVLQFDNIAPPVHESAISFIYKTKKFSQMCNLKRYLYHT